jgi:N-acetylneuraminic acid mutarotase
MDGLNKLRTLPIKKKISVLAVAGIIVVGVVATVVLLTPPATPASPPGTFTLSSNAGSPDNDGTFLLSWTAASGADNYTVYEHSSFITQINSSVTSLGTTASQSKNIARKSASTRYYMVRATNASGTTLSNCHAVTSAWLAWTWMKGNNTVDDLGSTGIKGSSSPTNNPSGRYGSVSWTAQNGNLLLFGGYGKDRTATTGLFNDFWRFDKASSVWTWLNGSDQVGSAGSYNTQRTPNPTNYPGARRDSVSWIDQNGDLWLFGGFGKALSDGYLNDLWWFNKTSTIWTWMNGSSVADANGTYGILGTPASTNTPGARYGSVSWVDASGDLWLFGGYGFDEIGGEGCLNDLWRFNVATCRWTWENGSKAVDQLGIYEIESANTPGGRYESVSWIDASGGLWLFGGSGFGESGSDGELNDLWRFSPATHHWTWKNGSKLVDQGGTYGQKGVPSSGNTPGGRGESVSWVDASGDLWLLGGIGHDQAGGWGYLNDLWQHDMTASKWTWMNGSNTSMVSGIYGTKGEPNSMNTPGARYACTSWADASGGLWLFGGYGCTTSSGTYGNLNDLWRYNS